MTLAIILAFCGIITFIAFRSTFFGLRLMAGMSWFALFIYMKDTPPGAVIEGSGAHTALLVIAIGFGLMIVLSGLGRGINQSRKWETGEEQITGGFKWKLPEWMKFNEDEPAKRTRNTDEALRDYRETLRRAYRSGEFSNRRRR
jgi:hypothetical protein